MEYLKGFAIEMNVAIRQEVKECFKQYIFYKKNKEGVEYYCTNCELWHTNYGRTHFAISTKRFRHNAEIDCPCCHTRAKAKSIPKGFKTLKNTGMFAVCQKHQDGKLQIDILKIEQSFDTLSCRAIYQETPKYSYLFGKNSVKKFEYSYGYKPKLMKTVSSLPNGLDLFSRNSYDETFLINQEDISSSDLRYCCFEELDFMNVRELIQYLVFYTKHNNVEYLVKQGFKNLVYEALEYPGEARKIINWKSNNLLKMLKLKSKCDLQHCKPFTLNGLSFYQCLVKQGERKPMELIAKFNTDYSQKAVLQVQQITKESIRSINKYIEKQKCQISTYKDYVNMALKAFGDGFEVYPKNLYKAHNKAVDLYKVNKNKSNNELCLKRAEQLQQICKYSWQGLKIYVPNSIDSIINEGKTLKHCVASYAERHAKGEVTIVFLRQQENPTQPYYTIELSDKGDIIQCYGYKNNRSNNPKPEKIKTFEKLYEEYLKDKLSRNKIKVG